MNNLDEINIAVHECVESCFGSADVVSKVAAFLEGLRASGWTKQQLHIVELASLEILSSIVVPRAAVSAKAGSRTPKLHGA